MFFSFTQLIPPPSFQEICKTKLYSLKDQIANNYRCFFPKARGSFKLFIRIFKVALNFESAFLST